jgi:hypothetical protein
VANQIACAAPANNRPWRPEQPVQQDGGDLMEVYLRCRNDALWKPVLICKGCGKTITESTRISDGVDYWHVGCQGRTMR